MLAFIQSDRAVVRKVLGGNPGAFRVLVDRYGAVIHGVAFARLQNHADAEDITQETFTRFYQQLDRMARHKHIGAWLVHVARNACVDVTRVRARETCMDANALAAAKTLPNPSREELHRLVWDQVQALDVESREVLVLHYFMKKKAREIAALLGITPDAAFKRVQRARDELGRRLTDLLGDEIGELMPDARRTDRIMAAVLATPVAWKASAAGAIAAATAAGLATGAGAAKLAAAVAVIAGAAFLGYLAYDRYANPHATQEITAQSAITIEEPQQEETAFAKAAALPASAEPQTAQPAAEAAGGEPVYPTVYGVVKGIVSMEDGTPAAGAEVWLENQQAVDRYAQAVERGVGDDFDPVDPVRVSATADRFGAYRLSGVPLRVNRFVSPYALHARLGDYHATGYLHAEHTSRETRQDLTLLACGSLGGVVKGADGAPIKDAYVRVAEYEGNKEALRENRWQAFSVTKEDGSFLFELLPVETCRLKASAQGYLETTGPWLKLGTTNNILQLDRGNSISGRVVNADTGQPVGDVRIDGAKLATVTDDDFASFHGEADSSGAFNITGIEKSGTYHLRIWAKTNELLPFVLAEPLTVTIGTQPVTGLELKLTRGAVIRGKIIDDETGEPPAGRTTVMLIKEPLNESRTGHGQPDGSYEVVGLHDGDLVMQVFCGTMLTGVQRYGGKITLKPGEVKEHEDIHLPVRKALQGTVVDDTEKPVPGASVCAILKGNGDLAGSAVSDASGRFRLLSENAPTSEPVYVQAITDDAYSAPVGPYRLNQAEEGIVLRVARSGRLEGEVVDQLGRPLEEGLVAAVPDSEDALLPLKTPEMEVNRGKSINVRLESGRGRFEYARLRPGAYTLEVYPRAASPRSPVAVASATIQAGRTTRARLVVDMSWAGGVEGVATLDGQPLPGLRVIVEPVDAKWLQILDGLTNREGRYVIDSISPGQVKVSLMPESMYMQGGSGMQKSETVTIVSGEVATVNFEFEGGQAAAEGYVMAGGTPLPYSRVNFEPVDKPGAGGPQGVVDSAGWYKVERIPEGVYRVEATTGSVTQSVQAELTNGQTARIDFDLRGCIIQGVVSGLKADEKAFIAVFPGDTQVPEWTLEALEALSGRMLKYGEPESDGRFLLTGLNEGEYIVAAVALPKDEPTNVETILGGRVVISPVVAATPAAPVEVELEIE